MYLIFWDGTTDVISPWRITLRQFVSFWGFDGSSEMWLRSFCILPPAVSGFTPYLLRILSHFLSTHAQNIWAPQTLCKTYFCSSHPSSPNRTHYPNQKLVQIIFFSNYCCVLSLLGLVKALWVKVCTWPPFWSMSCQGSLPFPGRSSSQIRVKTFWFPLKL